MKKLIYGFVLFSFIILIISCRDNETKLKVALPLIEKSIRSSIGWAKNKDFQLLYSVIANDSNYLEIGPGPGITKGFDEFKKNESIWGDPGFKAIDFKIRDLKINLSESGTVAWFNCVLDDINEWKGKPASWLNTRWTGVLEKRNSRWVIVQMHFSFAKE